MSSGSYNHDFIIPNRLAQGAFPGNTPKIFEHFDVVVYTAEECQPKFRNLPRGKQAYYAQLDDDIYRPVSQEIERNLWQLAGTCADHVRRGHRVLITCYMGANRSGLLMGLTLMRLNGMSGANAVALIKQRRTSSEQEALSNPMFEQFLRNTYAIR